MATVKSGKGGSVTFASGAYAEATKWSVTITADVQQFGVFGGNGFKDACTGQKSAQGTVEGKYDFDSPIEDTAEVGEEIALTLGLDESSSLSFTKAIIKEIQINVDGDTGEAVSFTLSWVSKGEWT